MLITNSSFRNDENKVIKHNTCSLQNTYYPVCRRAKLSYLFHRLIIFTHLFPITFPYHIVNNIIKEKKERRLCHMQGLRASLTMCTLCFMVLSCNTYDILSSGFIAKVNDVNSKMLLLENMFIYGQTTERYSLRYYITHNVLYNDSKSRLEKRFVCLVIVV